MSKIKLIAIDLDDTLFTTDKKVSPKNREALKKLKDEGIEIVIASGRFFQSVEEHLEELDLDLKGGMHIADGGGTIIDGDKVDYVGYFDKDLYLKTLSLLRDLGKHFYITDGKHVFYETDGPLDAVYNVFREKKPGFIKKIDNLEDVDQALKFIIYCGSQQELEEIQEVIPDETKAFISAKQIAEVTTKEMDKWFALEEILKRKGIDKSEVASIGDSGNDVEMVRNTGIGMTVANGLKEVKEAADYVAENDNDHDAVAELLDKYIF